MKVKNFKKSIAIILVAVTLVGCKKDDIPELIEPSEIPIDYVQVVKKDLSDLTIFSGAVTPEVTTIAFEADGKLADVNKFVGDTVKKNEVLGNMDTEDIQKQITAINGDITYANQMKDYEIALTGMEIEMQNQTIAKLNAQLAILAQPIATTEATTSDTTVSDINKKINDANTQIKVLQSNIELITSKNVNQVQILKDKLSKLQSIINDSSIKSPIDGEIIAMVNANNGVLTIGDSVISEKPAYYIADNSNLYIMSLGMKDVDINDAQRIYVIIDEKQYEIVKEDYTDAEISLANINKKDLPLKFKFKDESVPFEVGAYVTIYVENNSAKNTLTLPNSAIRNDIDTKYVIVDKDGVTKRVDIETGIRTALYTEITSGLKENEVVVVDNEITETEDVTITRVHKDNYAREVSVTGRNYIFFKTQNIYWTKGDARVKAIDLQNGEYVEKGDILATLSTYSNQSSITENNNKIDKINMDYDAQKKELDASIIELGKQVDSTVDSYDKAIFSLKLQYAKKKLEEITITRDYQIATIKTILNELSEVGKTINVTAPYSGFIYNANSYDVGHMLTPTEIICTISDPSTVLWMDRQSVFTRYNMELRVETEITGGEKATYKGRVVAASNVLSSNTYSDEFMGSSGIYAILDAENLIDVDKITAYGNAVEEKNVFVVDTKAVYNDGNGDFLYVKDDKGIHKQYILVGDVDTEMTWVLQGIDEETDVIIKKE